MQSEVCPWHFYRLAPAALGPPDVQVVPPQLVAAVLQSRQAFEVARQDGAEQASLDPAPDRAVFHVVELRQHLAQAVDAIFGGRGQRFFQPRGLRLRRQPAEFSHMQGVQRLEARGVPAGRVLGVDQLQAAASVVLRVARVQLQDQDKAATFQQNAKSGKLSAVYHHTQRAADRAGWHLAFCKLVHPGKRHCSAARWNTEGKRRGHLE